MGSNTTQSVSEAKGWLQMMRISNAPTILSNIMVGFAIGWAEISSLQTSNNMSVITLLSIVSIVFLIYFAGMILNDAFDATHDKIHRANRPIPSGVIQRKDAWTLGLLFLAVAVFVSYIPLHHTDASLVTPLLIITVLLYTFLHRWIVSAVVIMGLCRGLVYLMVLSAFPMTQADFPPASLLSFSLAIASYTMVLTFIGRFENEKKTIFPLLVWLVLLAPIYIAIMQAAEFGFAWVPLVAMVVWVWFAWKDFKSSENKSIAGMHKLLSGFCLLDCVLAASIGQYFFAAICVFCFLLTIALHRKILGT